MAQPTSRKKYYLQIAIKPEWTTSPDFLSDLRTHIESTSSQSLRDIFIAHSERRGHFCVPTKPIGDKLVSLFSTANISCRGRKPTATMVESPSDNCNAFQLHLSNINNVMNATEFTSWVLSLNCDASDIHLFPPQITSPATDCILSFNTIDSAICVKQKVQNLKFRQFPLYFRHWHVPRRITSTPAVGVSSENSANKAASSMDTNIKTNKIGIVLGLIDNSSVSSGYSSGSPIGAGPLYLRDRSVPPPPKRDPPPPPPVAAIKATAARAIAINKSDPLQHVAYDATYLDPISLEETRMSYEANMTYVSSLHNCIAEQEQLIHQLMEENQYILQKLDHQSKSSKYMETKYGTLCNKFMSLYHLNKILCWNVNDVIQWISSLENGRFIKYKEYLIYAMNQQNINGSVLSKLNKVDLHRLGIVHQSDQNVLLQHIHHLMHQKR